MSIWADRVILEQALACSRPWIGPGCRGISVNVGPSTLLDPGFMSWLSGLLEEGDWPWGWLQLELTEHTLITSSASLAEVLERLRRLGIKVVLDDFGTGFSSLTVLLDLPIHGIKCDQAFVRDLASDAKRKTLLRHLFAMGEELDLSVAVEGIETESELAIVREMGVHLVQGNLFSRPMDPQQVTRWLASYDFVQRPLAMAAQES